MEFFSKFHNIFYNKSEGLKKMFLNRFMLLCCYVVAETWK